VDNNKLKDAANYKSTYSHEQWKKNEKKNNAGVELTLPLNITVEK
jgi:hypothetical protein